MGRVHAGRWINGDERLWRGVLVRGSTRRFGRVKAFTIGTGLPRKLFSTIAVEITPEPGKSVLTAPRRKVRIARDGNCERNQDGKTNVNALDDVGRMDQSPAAGSNRVSQRREQDFARKAWPQAHTT